MLSRAGRLLLYFLTAVPFVGLGAMFYRAHRSEKNRAEQAYKDYVKKPAAFRTAGVPPPIPEGEIQQEDHGQQTRAVRQIIFVYDHLTHFCFAVKKIRREYEGGTLARESEGLALVPCTDEVINLLDPTVREEARRQGWNKP